MRTSCFYLFFVVFAAIFLFVGGCAGHKDAIDYNKYSVSVSTVGTPFPEAIVIYDSWSGNTESVARVIAAQMKAPVIKCDDVDQYDLEKYDLIVVGSPVHGGKPTGKIDGFLSGLEIPRASAVFVTYGAPSFGPASADRCLDAMEEKLHNTSIGRFKCLGFHQIFRTYPKHPDEKDRAEAAEFARKLMILCSGG